MMDMDYTFEDVKELFDKYNIKKENNKFYVTERESNTLFGDEQLVDWVKFSYTWIRACQYNRKRITFDLSIITDDDYYNAFNKHTEIVYNSIMKYSQEYFQAKNTMIAEDELIDKVKEDNINYKHTFDIISGLYSNERFFKVFEKWVRDSLI